MLILKWHNEVEAGEKGRLNFLLRNIRHIKAIKSSSMLLGGFENIFGFWGISLNDASLNDTGIR